MIIRPDVCQFSDCGKKVDIIYPVFTFARRGSHLFQSSGTSALSNWISEKFNLISPIPEDLMEEVKDTSIQKTEKHLFCAKCSEEITPDFLKNTVFLSCKYAIHYDCINNSRKKCSTCPVKDLGAFLIESTTQRRHSNESSTDNTSRKKVKSSGRDNSQILKCFIQELSTDIFEDDIILELDPPPLLVRMLLSIFSNYIKIFLMLKMLARKWLKT
ncbi:9095_t:CDS:1 [Funneliformis geosporum]|uniref:9095_t:CDS:1 n=1 Tax=Funneliformis geosporum TaxID=1117311 RepID=A0A9W4SS96_9GLOM|nr:9095_t:CDS:1 [Funneliformis geosporum]